MNDYIVNTRDYNIIPKPRDQRPCLWDDPSEPLSTFYDFAAEKPVRIGSIRLDVTDPTPLQIRMREAGKDL